LIRKMLLNLIAVTSEMISNIHDFMFFGFTSSKQVYFKELL
jgi:hypothetical protein